MSNAEPNPFSSYNQDSTKQTVLRGLQATTQAMKELGANIQGLASMRKRVEDMKKGVETVRSTATDQYLSDGNLPKVTASGRKEWEQISKSLEEILKDSEQMEKAMGISRKRQRALRKHCWRSAVASGEVDRMLGFRVRTTLEEVRLNGSCCWIASPNNNYQERLIPPSLVVSVPLIIEGNRTNVCCANPIDGRRRFDGYRPEEDVPRYPKDFRHRVRSCTRWSISFPHAQHVVMPRGEHIESAGPSTFIPLSLSIVPSHNHTILSPIQLPIIPLRLY